MIRDLLQAAPMTAEPADICIVGAGAAGIVLAMELVRLGRRVLLLEGGGADVEEASQEPYRSLNAGLPHTGIHIGRFRAHGGTTTRWGGQILELDDLDFEARPWIAGSGWPIAKGELKPFYARAIELEGLARATPGDDAVWSGLGLTAPAFPEMETFFSRWCPEPNFVRLHRAALMDDPAIETWLHANAVGLVVEGERIRGVRCRTLTGIERVFTADHFVFCLGGIESCRFFLQPEQLHMPWQRTGMLGMHFQDHVIASAATIEPIDSRRFHEVFDNVFHRGYKYQPKLRLARTQQEAQKTLNVAAMILFDGLVYEAANTLKSTARKFLRGRFGETSAGELQEIVRKAPLLARHAFRFAVQHRAYVPPSAQIALGVLCEQEPLSKSSITLAGERDSLGMLRTRLDWQVSEREIDSIRAFVEQAQQSLASIARVVPDADLMRAPERFRERCGDSYHHMGGMRMAASAADGIVNLDLRLHGVENGYVCSGAVFPTSGFSNPTHTVLALAVRLAVHLTQNT